MSKRSKLVLLAAVVGVALIGAAIGVMYATKKKPPTMEEKALEACHDAIRPRLKAPGSATWPTVDDQGVNVRVEHGDVISVVVVTSWVDAQNGFGAKIRTSFMCKLQPCSADGPCKVVSSELN